MKNKVVRFVGIYLIFMLFAVIINLLLEIVFRLIFEIPESLDILGIILFFSIFNLLGALIFFYKSYEARKMGLLSLIFGQVCEFAFMRPEWVLGIYALEISGETILPFIISSILYWFPAWGVPSYLILNVLPKFGFWKIAYSQTS